LCPHTSRRVETFQWNLTGGYFNTRHRRTFAKFPTLFHQRGGGISCFHNPLSLKKFQWILNGGYFNTPHLRSFENFPTLFHQKWGYFVSPNPSSRKKFLVDSQGGGYFCAPQTLHHSDILLSSRAMFMALRKNIPGYCVFGAPSLSLLSKPGFVLVGGCFDGRVKNCIVRKVAF